MVEQFAEVLRQYQVWTVYGDRYAGEWCREPFIQRNVGYEISERAKSDIYRDFLPLLNSRAVALLGHRRMRQQFLALERRTTRGGKDSIDHPLVATTTLPMRLPVRVLLRLSMQGRCRPIGCNRTP